jgi:LPXTG-motif cell wall-anchored protein
LFRTFTSWIGIKRLSLLHDLFDNRPVSLPLPSKDTDVLHTLIDLTSNAATDNTGDSFDPTLVIIGVGVVLVIAFALLLARRRPRRNLWN